MCIRDRLRAFRLPDVESRQARHLAQRRGGGRAVGHRAQGSRGAARAAVGREAQGHHPAADVRDSDSGGGGQQDHRTRDGAGAAQGRAGQVLRLSLIHI